MPSSKTIAELQADKAEFNEALQKALDAVWANAAFYNKLKKAAEIATAATSAAMGIAGSFQPIPHGYLLRKSVFPDRKTPHRIKRDRKQHAHQIRGIQMGQAAMIAMQGAFGLSAIMATPTYPKGSNSGNEIGIVFGDGGERICRPDEYRRI